jgi:hypothetical protein
LEQVIWESDLVELARWWFLIGFAGAFANNLSAGLQNHVPKLWPDDIVAFLAGPLWWVAIIGLTIGRILRAIFGGK